MKMFKFGSDLENIRPFANPSLSIAWPPVVFSRLVNGTNLCHAKNWPKSSRRLIFVLTSCVHFALRKAIVIASYQIVTSSLLLRTIIGGIGHFRLTKTKRRKQEAARLSYEGNTTTWSPRNIVVKSSYYCTMVSRWDQCWWTQSNFSRYNACRMCHGITKYELLTSFICFLTRDSVTPAIGYWPNSGPPPHEIQHFKFVCSSALKFGKVWRQHK